MTKLLDQALRAVAELPEAEQDALAAAILAEVASEDRWQGRFEDAAAELSRLADEALNEHRQGRSKPLDPDGL